MLFSVDPHQPSFACGVVFRISFLVSSFIFFKIGWKMWELWGFEILAFPLTWHIAYTTACCYRTSRDFRHETSRKNLMQTTLVLAILPKYCRHTTLGNAEVVVWPFTTMNSYWVVHARVGSEMINWKATNTIGNYCISSLLQHVLKISSASTNASGRRWRHSPTARPITAWLKAAVDV